jgi:hypothetical protein
VEGDRAGQTGVNQEAGGDADGIFVAGGRRGGGGRWVCWPTKLSQLQPRSAQISSTAPSPLAPNPLNTVHSSAWPYSWAHQTPAHCYCIPQQDQQAEDNTLLLV